MTRRACSCEQLAGLGIGGCFVGCLSPQPSTRPPVHPPFADCRGAGIPVRRQRAHGAQQLPRGGVLPEKHDSQAAGSRGAASSSSRGRGIGATIHRLPLFAAPRSHRTLYHVLLRVSPSSAAPFLPVPGFFPCHPTLHCPSFRCNNQQSHGAQASTACPARTPHIRLYV